MPRTRSTHTSTILSHGRLSLSVLLFIHLLGVLDADIHQGWKQEAVRHGLFVATLLGQPPINQRTQHNEGTSSLAFSFCHPQIVHDHVLPLYDAAAKGYLLADVMERVCIRQTRQTRIPRNEPSKSAIAHSVKVMKTSDIRVDFTTAECEAYDASVKTAKLIRKAKRKMSVNCETFRLLSSLETSSLFAHMEWKAKVRVSTGYAYSA